MADNVCADSLNVHPMMSLLVMITIYVGILKLHRPMVLDLSLSEINILGKLALVSSVVEWLGCLTFFPEVGPLI